MPEVWPVIHFAEAFRAAANARIVARAGCPGAFLICATLDERRAMDEALPEVREAAPSLKIGVNYPGTSPDGALRRSIEAGFDATWCDSAGVRSDLILGEAGRAAKIRPTHHPLFAGVAFKYLPVDPDPPTAAVRVLEHGFIPTTTGPATGVPPTVEKLAAIRAAIGPGRALACASGVTHANVRALGQHLTHVLVATGISKNHHELDPRLLDLLMARSAQS